ncbi:MAG TPA: hypothetical protein GX016_04055 [Firmicutes bacterium]|nr:hypothetical protein [Bacillota bacterium]
MTTKPAAPTPGNGRPRPRSYTAILSLAIAAAVLLASGSLWPFVYHEARQLARWRLERQLTHWPSLESDHFVVKYQPEDEKIAPLVLSAAEQAYSIITQEADFIPPHKTLVAVYPSTHELNAVFGWSPQESALGVYWGGAIRVLSPTAWIGDVDNEQLGQIFWACGPMVHEFTHLILDYKTAGNYPRWFSEGLAQYMELKHCGAAISVSSELCLSRLYSINELEKFSQLDDELLAYEQSLSLVEFLVHVGGPDVISKIVKGLAQGLTFSRSLQAAGMPSLTALEEGWLDWIK